MNLEKLKELYGFGVDFDFIFFWGSKSKDSKVNITCLSQFYKCDFEEKGIKYNCCEQYMMAKKAELFDDKEILNEIMSESNPKVIKGLGRKVRNFDSEIWDKNRINIVKNGNYLKFTQNEELKEYLLSTNDAILVEASPYDRIWGIGLSKEDKRSRNPNMWKGKNYLGFVLMDVRDIIKEETELHKNGFRSDVVKEIFKDLFGEAGFSDKYIKLLDDYDLSLVEGSEIKQEINYWNKVVHLSKYEFIFSIIDDFRYNFIKKYNDKFPDDKFNSEILDQYITNKLYWEIKKDKDKTEELLRPYIGEGFSEIFIKDLIEFNLLGKIENILYALRNRESKEFENVSDIRQYLRKEFKQISKVDKLKKEYPKTIHDAVYYLINNSNKEYIDYVKNLEMHDYSISEHWCLGRVIRNDFGLSQMINSELIYGCYKSEFNDSKHPQIVFFGADFLSPIILEEFWKEVQNNYDEIIKNTNFTNKLNRFKYSPSGF